MSFMIFPIILFSFFTSFKLVPLINQFGHNNNLFDNPSNRKSHSIPIVRLGGIAIFLSIFISTIISYFLNLFNVEYLNFLRIFIFNTSLFFSIGVLEDFLNISNLKKLILQIIAASFTWFLGLRIDILNIPFIDSLNNVEISLIISYLLTVVWIVGIVNAFNWLDGLDGLACGSSIIFCVGYSLFFLTYENSSDLIILAIIIASNFGFLMYNFYPAKIFMGDSGSYLVGSILAFFSVRSEILIASQNTNFMTFISQIIIMFSPIFDMAFVILMRILRGVSPFNPDRRHLHHRLMDMGLKHKDTVILFYFINIITCSIGISFLKSYL